MPYLWCILPVVFSVDCHLCSAILMVDTTSSVQCRTVTCVVPYLWWLPPVVFSVDCHLCGAILMVVTTSSVQCRLSLV